MRTYRWWLGQKARVRKKYVLMLGRYLSPKEAREWFRKHRKARRDGDAVRLHGRQQR